jgi:hypothetical protein
MPAGTVLGFRHCPFWSEAPIPRPPCGAVLPGQQASFTTRLLLRPLPHTLVVGVRDELGNTLSTVTVSYAPP